MNLNDSPFIPSDVLIQQYQLDPTALNKLIKEVSDIHIKNKKLEVENKLLKDQNEALIKQNLMMKQFIEDHQILQTNG